MKPPGRLENEWRSAQHEGAWSRLPGRSAKEPSAARRGKTATGRTALAALRSVVASVLASVLMLVLALCGVAAQAIEATPLAADPALEARVMKVADELRCLVCQNETIAASQAALAIDLRRQIRTQLQQGQSETQILDFMVQRYGEFVRYRPAFNPTNALLWIGPFVLLGLAAFVLMMNIRRRADASRELSDDERRRLGELLGNEVVRS